jgi:sugar phosphate isomerase/epimerase
MENIRIGTLIDYDEAEIVIPQIRDLGFESFSVGFRTTEGVDFQGLAHQIEDAIGGRDIIISTVGIYGNPLINEHDERVWHDLVENAHYFGTDIVSGFTGRIPNVRVTESIPRFKEVFDPLALKARDLGVRIAFENCDMGGNWHYGSYNIAFCSKAWELMFNELPYDNVGLEWEPCHQWYNLVDPIRNLRKWVKKVFHLHGKDASIDWDMLSEIGRCGPEDYAFHRTPGFGDTNWTDVISILRENGYKGTIDIEGYHDPAYRGEWEMTGQLHALRYLKNCRGGDYIPNYKL